MGKLIYLCHTRPDIGKGILKLCDVSSHSQVADILTKALSCPTFEDLVSKLGMINIYKTNLRGNVEYPIIDMDRLFLDKMLSSLL